MHGKRVLTESAWARSSSVHDTLQRDMPTGSPPNNPILEAETIHSSTQVNNAKVSSSRKNPFERFWSVEEEIRILKGILNFSKKFGDPFADKRRLYKFVRKATRRSCSTTQVKDKIRRLKNKYKRVLYQAAKKRKEPEFLYDHDEVIYDLSSQIWKDNVLLASAKEKAVNGSYNDHSAPKKMARSLLEELFGDFLPDGRRVCEANELVKELLHERICKLLISNKEEVERKCNEMLMMEIENEIKRIDHYKSLLQMMASMLSEQNPNS